jgi:hypothetical protein
MASNKGEKEMAPTTEIIATYPGEENTEAVLAKIPAGYSVAVLDKDSGEYFPCARIFKTKEAAEAYAKTATLN